MNHRLTELTEAFTEEGISKLTTNQTLTFILDGVSTSYKIKRIKDGRIWAKEIRLYHPDEIKIEDKVDTKTYWKNKVVGNE